MEEIPIEKVAIDSQVELISNNVRYRGTVIRLNTEEGKISLKDVEMIKGDKWIPVMGQLYFSGDDIQDIEFVDEEAVLCKMDPSYLLMKPFRKPLHLRGQNIPSDEEIVGIGRPDAKKSVLEGQDIEGTSMASSMNSRIIDKMDDSFVNAVTYLKQQKTMAVSAEGVMLSRQGELCWLVFGLESVIYIFDMAALGESAFTGGLAEILQSMRNLKIMHDCRYLSDYLFHKHQIFLQNVWDTQVARVVVFKQHHMGDLPRYVDSLPKTLQDVLGVDPNQFPFLWYRSYAMKEDQAIWRQRPLAIELQKVLEAQVSYLSDLRNALFEKMMMEMTVGVETYLKDVRDVKGSEVDAKVRSQSMLPLEFFKAAEVARDRYNESKQTSSIDPLTGGRECMGRMFYSKIRFSRDAWHGQKGTQELKELGGKGGGGDEGEEEDVIEEPDLD